MEVLVHARITQLVVARDHRFKLLRVKTQLIGQIVERVGLVIRSVLHARVPHRNQLVRRERRQRVVHAERVPLVALVQDGLRIVGRPDAVGDVLRLGQQVVGAVGSRNVLALVALGVHVHVEAHMETARLMASTPRALHHGRSGIGVLPSCARPQAHLLPVASVDAGEIEARVVIDLALFVAHERQHHGAVRGKHLLVAGEVARGQHHGPVRLEAHVSAAVHPRCHDARHTSGFVALALKVLGLRIVDDLDAALLRLCL